MAGKLWGANKTVRPILAFHGWQDNAGTFDRIIPMLPSHVGYLTIDFPGHGLSSRIPEGMSYNIMDFVQLINIIRDRYSWDKVSILAHSLGSIVGFIYNSLFPERCDMMIGIDVLKPLIRENGEIIKMLTGRLDKLLQEDKRRVSNSRPPCYSPDELIEKLYDGTMHSVTKETAPHLLERAIAESDTEPNRYYFTRDSRLKHYNFANFHQSLNLDMIKRITAPYLFVKASGGPYYEDKKYYDEAIAEFSKKTNFHQVLVDGTHHVHLTAPENCAEHIAKFITEHRPPMKIETNGAGCQ